ncbi:ATP-binding cassette domain-containing protein [Streptomyces sp. NPDC001978]|uniref:ABC transporter permease subunit n=1 Tax=Streptomyces sp. NPDC001978 TaxID=3364627 RepID=UPI0036B99E24
MDIIRFALLGLGTGAIYALLAQGIVLVYRGSGILNFAQGAIAMTGAYAFYDVKVRHAWPTWASLVFALVFCAVLGALIHLVVLRPMRRSSPLSRVIATLSITLCLQSIAFLRYGHDPLMVPSILPRSTVTLPGSIVLSKDVILIFVIGFVLTVALAIFYWVSQFGRVTTAVAEDQLITASLGHSPDVIASINWALGSVLAGLAGILIAPLIYLEPTTFVLLVLPAMSAALLGQFSSFPITFAVAAGLGVASSEIGRYVNQPGWASAAPFVVVVVVLLLRGQVIPLRSTVLDQLPAIGSGRVRPAVVVVLYTVTAWIALSLSPTYATALVTTVAFAIICLSVVVLTGYAGQLSLAQVVIAGVGALGAARVAEHESFLVALVAGMAIAALCGVVIGIPAQRTRGITLAIVTLGLGSAVVAVVFSNESITLGSTGVPIKSPELFGWSIDPYLHAQRYALVAVTCLVLLCVAVANLRRGKIGRRLIALRSNERAAAALGLPSGQLKAYAFTLSAGIAGVGGILLAFLQPYVQVIPEGTFTVFSSLLIVAVTTVGGVGMVGGALVGSTLIAGGIVNVVLDEWINIDDYLPLVGGLTLLFVLITEPSGLFEGNRRILARVVQPLTRVVPARLRRTPRAVSIVEDGRLEGRPLALVVKGLSVSFGGVSAVRDVDIEIRPGTIHGLIGPNGAGKTTLIDAVTGFVRSTSGTLRLGDRDLSMMRASVRSRAGVSRSFQSLELFDDLSIVENLAVAGEHTRPWHYLSDLIWPGRLRLTRKAQLALTEFELEPIMHRSPADVSFGERKAVTIARALASSPSVLLLDEPAAGLDDHEVAELSHLIRRVAKEWGVGVLLVEHKVDMILSLSDHITVLQNGAVLASGGVDDIMSDPAVVEAYLGAVPAEHMSPPVSTVPLIDRGEVGMNQSSQGELPVE